MHTTDFHCSSIIFSPCRRKKTDERSRTHTTDFESFVGHFFAPPGEKMTYKRRIVPCCRRLYCRTLIEISLDQRDLPLGLAAPKRVIRDRDILLKIGQSRAQIAVKALE